MVAVANKLTPAMSPCKWHHTNRHDVKRAGYTALYMNMKPQTLAPQHSHIIQTRTTHHHKQWYMAHCLYSPSNSFNFSPTHPPGDKEFCARGSEWNHSPPVGLPMGLVDHSYVD